MASFIAIPLHLKADDFSQEACIKRYDLHARMMALNPNGWRKPNKKGEMKNSRLRRIAAIAYPGAL